MWSKRKSKPTTMCGVVEAVEAAFHNVEKAIANVNLSRKGGSISTPAAPTREALDAYVQRMKEFHDELLQGEIFAGSHCPSMCSTVRELSHALVPLEHAFLTSSPYFGLTKGTYGDFLAQASTYRQTLCQALGKANIIDQLGTDATKAPHLPTIGEAVAALKTGLDNIQRLGQAMRKPFRHCQLTINELPTPAELMDYRQSVSCFQDSLADAQRRTVGDADHPALPLSVELQSIVGKVSAVFANQVEEHFVTEYAFLGFTSDGQLDYQYDRCIDAVREALALLQGAVAAINGA